MTSIRYILTEIQGKPFIVLYNRLAVPWEADIKWDPFSPRSILGVQVTCFTSALMRFRFRAYDLDPIHIDWDTGETVFSTICHVHSYSEADIKWDPFSPQSILGVQVTCLTSALMRFRFRVYDLDPIHIDWDTGETVYCTVQSASCTLGSRY